MFLRTGGNGIVEVSEELGCDGWCMIEGSSGMVCGEKEVCGVLCG